MKARELREIKGLTMACWWQSSTMGRPSTDWGNVAAELKLLVESEEYRFEHGYSSLPDLHNIRKLYQLAKDKCRQALERGS